MDIPRPLQRRPLQWGHGISAVESLKFIEVAASAKWLQWGHGISAVESVLAQHQTEILVELQWGHGISAVESVPNAGIEVRGDVASMGPRHLCRGISTHGTARSCSCCGSLCEHLYLHTTLPRR